MYFVNRFDLAVNVKSTLKNSWIRKRRIRLLSLVTIFFVTQSFFYIYGNFSNYKYFLIILYFFPSPCFTNF